ncbi:hypothetical protein [Arthrobacter mobilis]|uniref:Uncharacterized protein n=1 Tax=Arthrobacter mobilis TaxID=2724944 RepID=A0A7X6HI09_9MICC|nr:hypothetical protein [Arthrobacter mobilis]NKX56267.1 hypothetical protein [Arthrobacter mobilis]
MSKTPLEAAQAKRSATMANLDAARNNLQIQTNDAQASVAEVNRLKAAIAAGDASVAGQLVTAKGKADDLAAVIEPFRQAVAAAERAERPACLELVAETLKDDRGDLLTAAELAELEAETRATIDAAAAKLGEAILKHNAALAAGMAEVREAQKGLTPNVSVLVTESGYGSSFTRALFIDGQDYREASP